MCECRPPQCVLHTPLRWYDRKKWQPSSVRVILTPFDAASYIAVRILNPGTIYILGAGWGFCSASLFLLRPCVWVVGGVPASNGVFPIPGGRALWVEAGDGLAVQTPLGGLPVQDENSSSREPSAGS